MTVVALWFNSSPFYKLSVQHCMIPIYSWHKSPSNGKRIQYISIADSATIIFGSNRHQSFNCEQYYKYYATNAIDILTLACLRSSNSLVLSTSLQIKQLNIFPVPVTASTLHINEKVILYYLQKTCFIIYILQIIIGNLNVVFNPLRKMQISERCSENINKNTLINYALY